MGKDAAKELGAWLDAIQRIAFEIPPPNRYTPEIVGAVIQAREVLSGVCSASCGDRAIRTDPGKLDSER